MKKGSLRSVISVLLCLAMLFSGLPMTVFAEEAKVQTENIAKNCEITAPQAESIEKSTACLVDGNTETLYVANGSEYFGQGNDQSIVFTIPDDFKAVLKSGVKKIVLKFESVAGRTTDIDLAYANGTDTYTALETADDHDHTTDYVYESKETNGIDCTAIKINLYDPKLNGETGLFWPALAEVEIYADTAVPETENVAPYATVTSVGSVINNDNNPSAIYDGSDTSGYTFYNGTMSQIEESGEKAWIMLEFNEQFQVESFDISIPKETQYNHQYTYSIWGLEKEPEIAKTALTEEEAEEQGWKKLVTSQTVSGMGVNKNHHDLPELTTLQKVAIHVEKIDSTGTPWPTIAEFAVNVPKSTLDTGETDGNIALNKGVHTNYNSTDAEKIVDGDTTALWSGKQYPAYADIDLEKNYNINEVKVFAAASGYSKYSVYYSLNGRDFTLYNRKDNDEAETRTGNSLKPIDKDTVEARYIRVYVEYNSSASAAQLREVQVFGEPSDSEAADLPAINVSNYDDWLKNQEGVTFDENGEYVVTEQETIDEVKDIIERRLGETYKDWFEFEIAEGENGYDYYELSNGTDGKIKIKGNNGVSLATGLNYYLKYFCKVNISQSGLGDQTKMPETAPKIDTAVHMETKFPVRYSYNYCTLSYTMSFWGEKEWREELDWLALNGVNAVLDATGQEEVWRRVLTQKGYTKQEIRDFIAGPAYYAWAYMDNISGFGGPVHDSWFETRTELARKNQLSMRRLGMQPVLQGYCGMVPENILEKDSDLEIIDQSTWNSFTRPPMIKTTTEGFKEYAQLFYECQQEVFGDWSHYYATDPFHEGGKTGDLDLSDVGKIVMEEMLTADPNAVWVIQSWQGNPKSSLLSGIKSAKDNSDGKHALILDLFAETDPHYDEGGSASNGSYGSSQEFDGIPWAFCMLNNFGGRMGLHGHMDSLINIANVANETSHMAGIGITPEGSQENPILYDFFFETIWTNDASKHLEAIDINSWIEEYTLRRYGAESDSANEAVKLLVETVYNSGNGQGAPESVVNARPRMSRIDSASTWGYSTISYSKVELQQAAELLLADYDKLKNSDGYLYDLADVLKQILSNTAQEYHEQLRTADNDTFDALSEKFLSLIDEVEKVLSTQKRFLFGTWEQAALALAENTDDFTKDLYRFNARALVTTWGSYAQSESGQLHDYSNRQWSGLTSDFYKARWEKYLTAYIENNYSDPGYTSDYWFAYEWQWVISKDDKYTATPSDEDLKALGEEILKEYSLEPNPAEDDSHDLPIEGMSVQVGSEEIDEATENEGPARFAIDNDPDTYWHSEWDGDEQANLWIVIDLGGEKSVDGLRYLPRNTAGNGTITGYTIDLMVDGKWVENVASGSWDRNSNWKIATFDPQDATKVRLNVTSSVSDQENLLFASAAEIRITGTDKTPEPEPDTVDKSVLEKRLADAADAFDDPDNKNPDKKTALNSAIANGLSVFNDTEATQKDVDDAVKLLDDAIAMSNSGGDDTDPVKLGDVDGDGDITPADVTLVLQHIAVINTLTGDSFTAANVDKSESIDTTDATMILQYIALIITSFE